jgi:hypothetical protein
MSEPVVLDCPYCGESFETSADPSAGSQTYTEDCAVCCRPIVVKLEVGNDGEIEGVSTRRESD